MDLTLNEMRALKRFAEDAIENKNSAQISKFSCVKDRWEILEKYLRAHRIGIDYGADEWTFRQGEADALEARLNDLIKDVEQRQKDASKMAYASWLAALSALVSALTALVALLCRNF